MKTYCHFTKDRKSYFLILICILFGKSLFAQTELSPYVIFGGQKDRFPSRQTTPLTPGYGVQIGSTNTIQGGSIGSYHLVKTSGITAGTISNPTNIHSWGIIQIGNSNTVIGKITAANQFSLPSMAEGSVILSVGSSAVLGSSSGGDIDVRGSISIGGGSVLGKVTIPPNIITPPVVTYTYSGPAPAGGPVIRAVPTLPSLPVLNDTAKLDELPYSGFPSAPSFSTSQKIRPNISYGNITLNGNKTVTFDGPGIYVINSITNSGTSNNFVFNFKNKVGTIRVYVRGNVDLGKIKASLDSVVSYGGGPALGESRVYLETHGRGVSASNPVAFSIANGSAGSASKWVGTVYAPFAAINIGSGTGSTNLTGALWSGTQVNLQSGIATTFAPFTFCDPTPIDAGPDRPLDFSNITPLKDLLNNATTYTWRTIDGGVITPTSNIHSDSISVSSSGTYILTADSAGNCYARDTVRVTSKLKSLIGSELQSIYDNKTTDNTFFDIANGFVMIDVIVNTGYKKAAYDSLIKPFYGLDPDTLPNGTSPFIITGRFPVNNLPRINKLFVQISFCMPHNFGVTYNSIDVEEEDPIRGKVRSAGDTAMRSYLVRKGYNLTGKGIKIGIISNSYNTIVASSTDGPIKTYNEADNRLYGDVPDLNKPFPDPNNPNTFSKRVNVLKDLPVNPPRSDEGRAMAQVLHDVAPGAELYFHTGSVSAGDFAQGIRKLDSAGCKIIVDDITYITEPFLKNGVVANAVDTAAKHGVSYFSAAGNFANWSYEKNFNAVAAPVNVGFAVGAMAHNFGSSTTDIYDSVTFLPGSYTIVLQWTDDIHSIGQGGTHNDLDIYLTPKNDGTARFGFNRDNTDGDPIEFISFTTTETINTNILIVNNTAGSNPSRIKLIVYRGTKNSFRFNENMTNVVTSTITGQSNAAGAITIGAARYDKTDSIEYYSSIGGTVVNGVTRNKPDLTGPDGGSTSVKMGNLDYNGDGYYDFFGTSAAAPHAAGVAALIMEGRKRFRPFNPTTPDSIRSVLDTSAIDMYSTLNLSTNTKFDFTSGHGFINADLAMRSIANPTPFLIDLVGPPYTPDVVPGSVPITLTITGENFSNNSEVVMVNGDDTTRIDPLTIFPNMLTVEIGTFTGSPEVFVYTPPKTDSADGGFSNSLNFFDADVVVRILSDTITYGQPIPVFNLTNTIITVNDTLLQNTNRTLESLGLNNMTLVSSATASSNVDDYDITALIPPNNLLPNYNYKFIKGNLRIDQLPVRITAHNINNAVYGEQLPDIQYSYEILNTTGLSNPDSLLNVIRTAHQNSLAKNGQGDDILGLVNEQAVTIENDQAVTIENDQAVVIENTVGYVYTFNGDGNLGRLVINPQELTITNNVVTNTNAFVLSLGDIDSLSFLASEESLSDSRTVLSNQVIDISEESLLWFNKNSGLTYMLSSVSNTDKKGLVGVNSYVNEQAIVIENDQAVTIENDQAVVIENDQAVTIENDQAVVIENDQAVIIENGIRIPITSDENTAVIVNEVEIGGGDGPSNLKSLAVVTGLEPGTHFIIPAALPNSLPGSPSGSSFGNNFKVNYVPGILTITDPCLIIRPPFNNFGSTPTVQGSQRPTSLWVNVAIKLSGQLKTHNRYLKFTGGAITLKDITATDPVTNTQITTMAIPNGKVVADTNVKTAAQIYTKYINGSWETHVPIRFSSTSDIFISGAIINSKDGFVKKKNNANSSTIVQGIFYSDTVYSDQWTYALATYRPYFDYAAIAGTGGTGKVVAINGTYRAGTPLSSTGTPILTLVNGASGGGGNNYTGSTSSFDNFTACCPTCPPPASLAVVPAAQKKNSVTAEVISTAGEVKIVPNPASDYINFSFVPTFTGNSKIVLYMIDGTKVYERDNGVCEAGKAYMKKIDVSKLINGIYIVELTGKDKTTIKKIIISH